MDFVIIIFEVYVFKFEDKVEIYNCKDFIEMFLVDFIYLMYY